MRTRIRPGIIIVMLIILFVILGFLGFNSAHVSAPKPNQSTTTQKTQPQSTPKAFNKQQYSLDEPTSLWVIINKKRPLPDGYAPSDLTSVGGQQLRSAAASSLANLTHDAGKAGAPLIALSGYRSQATQTQVYSGYVQKDGVAAADRYSARPRYSDHQTGWAVDLGNSSGSCTLDVCFGNTTGGKWLKDNAYKYGFVVRYPSGKEAITGYQYEPWHIRYVGTALAAEIQKSGQTLEEFFGLPTAADY